MTESIIQSFHGCAGEKARDEVFRLLYLYWLDSWVQTYVRKEYIRDNLPKLVVLRSRSLRKLLAKGPINSRTA